MGPPARGKHSANGIRTRVPALRGLCPGPLDDSAPHFICRPGRNRTCNPRFWRPVLYQLSYGPSASPALRSPACSALPGWLTGLEPATSGATVRRSNRLSYNHHGRSTSLARRQGAYSSVATRFRSSLFRPSARNLPLGPTFDWKFDGAASFARPDLGRRPWLAKSRGKAT
jgi:hypothetical protein